MSVLPPGIQEWAKHAHLARMQASGHFRVVTELGLLQTEPCSAARIISFTRTLRPVLAAMASGLEEEARALTAFEQLTQQRLGTRTLPGHVSYRIRVGLK
ncbi:MAG: hypothetical protein AB7N91_13845 [Candidatus Tectimicrobiota bacterium]